MPASSMAASESTLLDLSVPVMRRQLVWKILNSPFQAVIPERMRPKPRGDRGEQWNRARSIELGKARVPHTLLAALSLPLA